MIANHHVKRVAGIRQCLFPKLDSIKLQRHTQLGRGYLEIIVQISGTNPSWPDTGGCHEVMQKASGSDTDLEIVEARLQIQKREQGLHVISITAILFGRKFCLVKDFIHFV